MYIYTYKTMKRRRESDEESDETTDSGKRHVTLTRHEIIMQAHYAQLNFNRAFGQRYDNYTLLEYVIAMHDLNDMSKFVELMEETSTAGEYRSLEELKKMV